MRKYLLLIPALFLSFTLSAQEEDEYDIEESCDEEDVCVPGEVSYHRQYRCRHRYMDYYDYEDRDIDATWPGKMENSFMEDLMR